MHVTARLSSATMPAGQDTNFEFEDGSNGTYRMQLVVKGPAEVKLTIYVQRERPGSGKDVPAIEFPAISMSVATHKQAQFLAERELKRQGTVGSGGRDAGSSADSVTSSFKTKATTAQEQASKPKHTPAPNPPPSILSSRLPQTSLSSSSEPGEKGAQAHASRTNDECEFEYEWELPAIVPDEVLRSPTQAIASDKHKALLQEQAPPMEKDDFE